MNGTQRNVIIVKVYDFDKEATEYSIHQLYVINRDATSEFSRRTKNRRTVYFRCK